MAEWINAQYKLPELPDGRYVSKQYIVCADGSRPFVTAMNYVRTEVRGKIVERWEWRDRISPWIVTHWMPLPEAPKEDNDV